MYFFRTDKLREELVSDKLTKRNELKYLIFSSLIYAITGQFASNNMDGSYLIAETSVVIMTIVLGLIWCYDANQKGDGKNFIQRFVCLNVPVTINLSIIFVLFISLLVPVINRLEYKTERNFDFFNNDVIELVFLVGFQIVYFWRIKQHIEIISEGSKDEKV